MDASTARTDPSEPAPPARLIRVVRTAIMRGNGIVGTAVATEHADGRGRLTLRLAGVTATERYVVRLLSRVSQAAEHGLEIAEFTLRRGGSTTPFTCVVELSGPQMRTWRGSRGPNIVALATPDGSHHAAAVFARR
jgi:hypothetical protein